MLRAPVTSARLVVIVCVLWVARFAGAQDAPGIATLGEMPLPGGLQAALAAAGDPVPGDSSQFLIETIRRAYASAGEAADNPGLRALIAHLEKQPQDDRRQMLPLPLTPALWTTVILRDRVGPGGLAATILGSRTTAQMYCGLLALDDATRSWLAGQPELLGELAARWSASFVLAAPGLRVAKGIIRAPGGQPAEPIWEALVGRPLNDPVAFVRALVGEREGRYAHLLGAVSSLTPAQLRVLFALESASPSRRVLAARRIAAVMEGLGGPWRLESRAISRAPLDPLLLVADLRTDRNGRPVLHGTDTFWTAALGATKTASVESLVAGQPVDFDWLAEQAFRGNTIERRALYNAILFGSRRLDVLTTANAKDSFEAVRAAAAYPALTAALERAGLDDLPTFAIAGRRAARLCAITDRETAVRAITQYQGALALVLRAASSGTIGRAELPRLVASLSGVEVSDRGDYQGRMLRWLDGNLPRDPIALLAGSGRSSRFVDWEGTRYRVDLPWAEATRLGRILHDEPTYLAAARTLADIADRPGTNTDGSLQEQLQTLGQLADTIPDESRVLRGAASALPHGGRATGRAAASLQLAADDLLARALVRMAYAMSVGQPESLPLELPDLAARHEFRLPDGRLIAWALPSAGSGTASPWHVTGSLLGLDAALASLSLIRVSQTPPTRRPTLSDADRRVFVEAVALVDPRVLTDGDRDAIVAALARGRDRLAHATSRAEIDALADDIRLSPVRRTLLAWVVAHDPKRAGAYLSLTELLWAGLAHQAAPAGLAGWGAPAGPRLGCLCVQFLDPRPLDAFDNRWGTGLVASGFADLNLRLAELLADLHMPASLLGPVLASATLQFVEGAVSRDPDDRRGLLEYVRALPRERVEQYLATLTTDGPLVPVADAAGPGGRR